MPNRFGGRENLEAIAFLQQLNRLTHGEHPGTITAAEESTAFPGVSRPVHLGGLGFTYKWNMGWMHDILAVHARGSGAPPLAPQRSSPSRCSTRSPRTSSCRSRTTKSCTAKRSMLDKMPGDVWQKHATLRALYGYMFGHPGQEAAVHGRRVRPVARMEPRSQPRLAPARRSGCTPALQRYVQDLNWHLSRASRRCTKCDFDPGRLPLDRLQRQREQRRLVRPLRDATAATSS